MIPLPVRGLIICAKWPGSEAVEVVNQISAVFE